jgi:hypothetical protein
MAGYHSPVTASPAMTVTHIDGYPLVPVRADALMATLSYQT